MVHSLPTAELLRCKCRPIDTNQKAYKFLVPTPAEHLFIELESKFEAVSAELAETKASQNKLTGEHQDTCT